ncbi:MAG: DUF5658 family protein [Fimbriimonadales bacterium]
MALELLHRRFVRVARPPLPVLLLVIVAVLDMISTAVLYSMGMIVELNPIMRPVLYGGVWQFCLVKSLTIILAFLGLQWYRAKDEKFVMLASKLGVTAYLVLWTGWFLYGSLR